MSDVEIKSENTQVQDKPQEINNTVSPAQIEQEPDIKSEENKANWKKFRENQEKMRQAKIEADRIAAQKSAEVEAYKAAMEALLNKQSNNQPMAHIDNEDNEETKIQKLVAEALEREKQKYKQEQEEFEKRNLPNKLSSTHNDFNTVCNAENLDYLEFHYPEVSAAFRHMPESFEKWDAVYKAVKRFVPYQNKNDDAKRIEQNLKKPQGNIPNLTDTKPQGAPWILTEERRKANWARMQKDMKSFG